jgi:hypothetical protein
MGVWDLTATRIAYSSASGGNLEAWVAPAAERPRIVVVQNWFEELKWRVPTN